VEPGETDTLAAFLHPTARNGPPAPQSIEERRACHEGLQPQSVCLHARDHGRHGRRDLPHPASQEDRDRRV